MAKNILFIFLIIFGVQSAVFADGTAQISADSNNLSALALMPSALHGPTLSSDSSNKLKFYISSTSERLHYGFNFTDYSGTTLLSNVYIVIRNSAGTIVSGPTALPTSGAGFIHNAREAFVGPNVGSVTTGYNPITFVPGTTGEFSITLYRSDDGGATESSSTTWSKSTYFDLTVTNTAGTTIYPGRVFCRKWGLVAVIPSTWAPSGTADAAPVFYSYSADQTITKLTLNDGFRPVAFSIAMTKYGVTDGGNWLSDRNSVNSSGPVLSGGYRLFLQYPDTLIYPVAPIPTTPSLATPAIVGCSAPYTVRFNMPSAGDARILFDLNGVPGFQAGTADRILEALNVAAGLNTTSWDGLNGLGGAVVSGTNLNVSATYQRGRFNLPLFDAEINSAGIKADALAPINVPNIRLYWNDLLATPTGLCPDNALNQTDSGINNSLLGTVSPAHAWSGSGNPNQIIPAPFVGPGPSDQCDDFGNVRVINTWGWALQSSGSATNIYFGCYTISGSVFNDANGLTDNTVNSTSSPATPVPTGLYAHLVGDGGTTVVQTVAVDGSGNYTFTNVTSGSYRVVLNTSSTASSTPGLPSGWVNTGEKFGSGTGSDSAVNGYLNSVDVANTNVTNANFGIEQIPTPTGATMPTRVNPNGTATANISAGFTGTDVGGAVTQIKITTFPTNATSIKIGATTYTSGTWPPAGVTYTIAGTTVELDPIDGAVTSVINFKVIDNANVESTNTAVLNVPFILVPPVAINVTTQAINSHAAETAIPQLLASSPMGTAISSYTVTSVPTAAQGVLYYCATFPPTCTSGGYTAITAGTILTPNQAASLFFDPAQTFTGNVNFNYYATDANSLQSNSATYTIPVYNEKPVTQPIRTTQIIDTMHAAPLPDLRGADADGTVVSYTLNSIPSATQGVLSYCSTADEPCTGVVTTITSGTTISPAQMKTLKFDPTLGFSGDYVFQYVATDDNGKVSSPSPFAIPVVPVGTASGNQPPIAENITAQVLNSSWGRTAIPNMLGTDPDGSVISYTIGATIPNTTTEGTLYYCASAPCTLGTLTVLSAGAVLTPTQAASIHFDPVQGFIGTASFTYTVLDNGAPGLTSNVATYNIPVSNNPPIANPTSTSPILNTKVTPTLLPTLSGSDQDGTVASYNITSVPAATDGTLKYCVGPGACTAGTLTTISGPISGLTPTQAATLNFIPSSTFTGNYVFNYVSVDNNGLISQPAPVTVPVVATAFGVGEPPVAYSFNAAAINSSSTASLPTALTGTDPDGTVVHYTLRSIPIATSGTLTYCTTPPSTGCGTATAVGTVLSAAQAATLLFTPDASFKGIASFTYTNTDNDSNLSNTATVTIPVNNAPPQALNIANPAINRTAGPTTLNPLSSSDIDGTVVSYTIQSIPSADQGVLSLCTTPPATGCTPVTVGQVLTPAQISRLAFNPDTLAYVPVISFMYSTLDNSGNISNLASVDIPILNALDLPVELISFTAVKQGDRNALISWITGVEEPGVRYQLMHGTDGKFWSMINEQSAFAANGNNYNYQHQNVNNGIHYYRLRILDAHKAESYSPVRTLNFNNGQAIAVTCQPNPVSEKVYLSTSDGSELSLVEIYSNEGRRVKAIEHLSSGTSIDLSDCAIGLYLIKATDAQGQTQVIKISKR